LNPACPDRSLTRAQLAAFAVVILVAAAWLVDAAVRNPDVPFVRPAGGPDWIMPAVPVDSNAIRVDLDHIPEITFSRRFELDEVPGSALIRARALREAEYFLNGKLLVPQELEARSWKRASVLSATEELQRGENELSVRVRNPGGPALLQLELKSADGALRVETDDRWLAFLPTGRGPAQVETMKAIDTRPHPQSRSVPPTSAKFAQHAVALSLCFVLSALLYGVLGRVLSSASRTRIPEFTLAAVSVFWIAVYAAKTSQLPVLMGFDIVGHLEYIDFLRERRALPLATDGWSTYHPPLAHLVTALLVGPFDLLRESDAARWLYRLPTFAAGLGNVWLVYFAARRLFRRDPLRTSLAVAFAGLLPMNVYMSAYVSNEPLNSFLVSLSLLLACDLLQRSELEPARILRLAGVLGLAILTKFTALVAVPLVAVFAAAKASLQNGRRFAHGAAVAGGLLAGTGLVGGWWYLRNWLLLGRPVVGNWDLPGNAAWWEQPGFHTLGYYTSFGASLQYPFFAGYHSFWDGVYSTFWGDGLVAGMIRLATRHAAWNYDFMMLGYWLALPATALLILGFGRGLRFCVRADGLDRRVAMSLLMAFLFALSFALLAITLRLPYYAQAKAFYTLSGVLPLALVAGLGLAWIPERLTAPRWLPLRVLYSGWLGTLACVIVMSFLG
jgi:hypothetical protein